MCSHPGIMKTNFYDLVIVAASGPLIWKIRISRAVVLILTGAFLVSFAAAVAAGYAASQEKLNKAEYLRLQNENLALGIEKKNAEIRVGKIERDLQELEVLSHRVDGMINAD